MTTNRHNARHLGESYIRRRWKHWYPWALFTGDGISWEALAARHRARLAHLLAVPIPTRRIVEHNLDDPRPPDADWQARLDRYLEARRPQPNIKGQLAR